jgi:hypothetical protein
MSYLKKYIIPNDTPYSMELRFLQDHPDLYEPKSNSRPIPAKELAENLACRNRKWVLSRDGQILQNSIETFMAYLDKNPENEIYIGGISTEKNHYCLYIDNYKKTIIGCIKSTIFKPGTEPPFSPNAASPRQ